MSGGGLPVAWRVRSAAVTANAYEHPVSPRYLEVDRQGIVFNMWYLAYFDEALAGFLGGPRGLPYPQLLADGYDVSLVHTELDWTAGLAYGDAGAVAVTVEAVGRTPELHPRLQRPPPAGRA